MSDNLVYEPQLNAKNPHLKSLDEFKLMYEESIKNPKKFLFKNG